IAIAHCRGRIWRGARQSRAPLDKISAPRADCAAQQARRPSCCSSPKDRAATPYCRDLISRGARQSQARPDKIATPRPDCPAPRTRRRPCCSSRKGRAAIRHCRDRISLGARQSQARPDKISTPRPDCPGFLAPVLLLLQIKQELLDDEAAKTVTDENNGA